MYVYSLLLSLMYMLCITYHTHHLYCTSCYICVHIFYINIVSVCISHLVLIIPNVVLSPYTHAQCIAVLLNQILVNVNPVIGKYLKYFTREERLLLFQFLLLVNASHGEHLELLVVQFLVT